MSPDPATPDPRPAGNQFSLRGLFVLITVVSPILALLALAIRQPVHWLGTLCVIAFCLLVIACLEGIRQAFPRKAPAAYDLPPLPSNPFQARYFSDGESPFGSPPGGGESPFAPRKSLGIPPAEPAEPDQRE